MSAPWAKWEAQAKAADILSLRYMIQDCVDAERAMRGHNAEREGFYADQAHTFRDELRRRLKRRAGK